MRGRVQSLSAVFAILFGSCTDATSPERHSEHGDYLSEFQARTESLAARVRAISSRNGSFETDVRLREDILAICRDLENPRVESEMKTILDSGIALSEMYPKEIAKNLSSLRCTKGFLMSGEVINFDRVKRVWVNIGKPVHR